MKRARIVALGASALALVAVQACSGDDTTFPDAGDASSDTTQPDVSNKDVTTNDVSNDVKNDVITDAGDAGCPASWTEVPDADITLAVPSDGGGVLLHGAATGTQDYTCTATTNDAGTTYAWLFVGPEATLDDCTQTLFAHHFASEAGATAPEWQTLDNSFVIGKKLVAFTPDGGGTAVPWLLIQETANGGTGTISKTHYVQRLYTTGGIAPTTTCDGQNVNTTTKVAYTADYYFYGF